MKNAKTKRDEASIRAEARAKRTPKQQLKHLDRLLGKGKGATKERARLNELNNNNNTQEK